MCHKIREDIRRKTRTKTISDFLRRAMFDRELPDRELLASSTEPEPELAKELIVTKVEAKLLPPPPPSLDP